MGRRRKNKKPDVVIVKAKYVAMIELLTISIVGITTAVLAYAGRLSADAVAAIFGIMLLYAFGRTNGTWKNPVSALADVPDKVRLWRLVHDPGLFARTVLGFAPYPYQAEFLEAIKSVKRAVLCWGRQTGKTTVVAAASIWFAFTHPGTGITPATVLIVSKGLRQSIIMFRTIKRMIHSNPLLERSISYETRTCIELSNHAQIIVLPCGHDGSAIRGPSVHLLIVDEAAFMKESIIQEVCFPMLATTDGSLFMLSTPYGKKHIFYRSFVNPNYWKRQISATECPGITKEFLEQQEIELGRMKFRQEYLAEFIDDSSSWLPQDLIRDVVDDYRMIPEQAVITGKVETGKKYLHDVGVDFGKKGDHSVIVVWRREKWQDGSEKHRLVFRKEFPLAEPEEYKKKHKIYAEVINYLKLIILAFDTASLVYDQTGVGEALGEDISELMPQAKGVILSDPKKKDVMTFFRARMEQWRMLIPYDKDILDQFNIEEFHLSGDKLLFSHPDGTHDDQLWAAALGLFGTYVGETKVPLGGVVIR